MPNWLDFNIINGVIEFRGTPKNENEGEIKIEILDKSDFVIREFFINVEYSEKLENYVE